MVRCPLEPKLDLGVGVFRRRRPAGDGDFRTGDSEFDDAFVVAGDDATRLTAFFTDEIRDLLLSLPERQAFSMSDRGLVLSWSGIQSDPATLRWALGLVTGAASAAEIAARSVPPSFSLRAQLPEWEALARAHGLSITATPFGLRGRFSGVDVSVYVERTIPQPLAFHRVARFDRPLGLGLRVGKTGAHDWQMALVPGWDLPTGDAAFDASFVVQCRERAMLSRVLGDEVRGRLLALAERTPYVAVSDEQVGVRFDALPAVAEVEGMLVALVALARALAIPQS